MQEHATSWRDRADLCRCRTLGPSRGSRRIHAVGPADRSRGRRPRPSST